MRGIWRAVALVSMLVGLLSMAPADPAQAAGVVGDGTSGSCTEAALDTALSGGGLVAFNCGDSPVTIPLTSTKVISINTQIDGDGLITLDGQNGRRIFSVDNSIAFEVTDITLTGGATAFNGGAIFNNEGFVTITGSTVEDSLAQIGGGGIYNNQGTVTLTNSTLSGSTAADAGGGIYNNGGTVTFTNSTLSGNAATFGNGGGILNNGGSLTLTDSTLSGNTTGDGSGGGIFTSGTTTLTNSALIGNTTDDSDGGGIYNTNDGTLTLAHSTLSGNIAGGFGIGGGIFNDDGTLTLTDSTLNSNSAVDSDGGGIYTFGSGATLTNSTLSDNSAAAGGGIFNDGGGTITLTNSTLSGNSADNEGGGIFNSTGGTVNLSTTIVANSVNGDCAGDPLTSQGGNLGEDIACALNLGSDLNGVDPVLGPLADNGGPTQTHLPQPGSPAIDQASCVTSEDQRGVSRPQGPDCDIGSVEVGRTATYPLCVSYYTGSVTSPLYGQGCAAGAVEIEPFNQAFCINPSTGQVFVLFWGSCNPPRFEHTMPDDGDLLTCVSYATGTNRWVWNHSQCGLYERPNTIPATP